MTPPASRIASWILLLAALASVPAACGRSEGDAPATPAEPAVVEIGPENVVRVEAREISVGPLISGELRAAQEATVRAEVGGSVLAVTPEEGQRVTRGTLLARIEERTLRDDVTSAQSAVRSAEHALDVARREAERSDRLVKAGAVPERELETARTSMAAAEAQLEDARARLASARKTLGDATVRSPITGVISKRHVSVGDVVSPGRELYTVIDPSSMRLEASVPSSELAAVRPGGAVRFQVRGYPDQTFTGTIARISPTADPITRQVPIFVEIPNTGGRLLAGLFAEGRIERESRRALAVPLAAVGDEAGATSVMRVRDGKVEQVPVTLGLRDPQTEVVEVASGVAAGDVLLVGAARGITTGTPVRIRQPGQPG